MTSVSSSVNPSGIVVPAGGLQQGNVAMTTINSQVVSGKLTAVAAKKKKKKERKLESLFWPSSDCETSGIVEKREGRKVESSRIFGCEMLPLKHCFLIQFAAYLRIMWL